MRRIGGLAAAALVVVVVAVVVATSGTTRPALSARAVALGGAPPRTAVFSVSASDGPITAQGTVSVDFGNSSLAAEFAVPTLFSTAEFSAVDAADTLYLGSPTLASLVGDPWASLATEPFPYAKLAAELQDTTSLLSGVTRRFGPPRITHHGAFTRYRYADAGAHVALPPDLSFSLPASESVVLSVTVGPQGQFAAGALSVAAPSRYLALGVRVVSYDRSVVATAPAPNRVRTLDAAIRRRVFGSSTGAINRLLTAAGLASLSRITIAR